MLTYGMARELVIQELGSPTFESIIRSLQRARVVYADSTRLVVDRDSLVLVQTVIPPKWTVMVLLSLKEQANF